MTETPDVKPAVAAEPPLPVTPDAGPAPQTTSTNPSSRFARKRMAFIAMIGAVAGAAGAFGAAVAVAVMLPPRDAPDRSVASAQNEAVAKVGAEVAGLRVLVEGGAKAAEQRSTKLTERLDRIEKAMAEPNARLAKLSDAVEKLRAPAVTASVTPPPAPAAAPPAATPQAAARVANAASAVPRDVTGAVTPAASPAVIPGWTVRDVIDGGAVLRGPRGLIDVFVGDTIPGVGRVEAIRRQDGRWVVVTAKGNIVAR